MTRYLYRDKLHWAALTPALCLWVLCEILRLNLGTRGILRSHVPHLVSFLLLTVFPQTLLTFYIGFLQECLVTTDQFLGGVLLGLMVIEMVFVFVNLRFLAILRSNENIEQSNNFNQRNSPIITSLGKEIEKVL
jgi:hypothetical protein